MIKAVLFDFGGVLTEAGKAGSIADIFAKVYGIGNSEVQLAGIQDQLFRGLIATEAFFAELNRRHPGKTKADERAFLHHKDLFRKSEPVYALAARLREHGVKTGILSNVIAVTAEELQRHGLYDDFDPLILSYKEHMAKPDFEFYELAIKRCGADPREIVFVDDQEKCRPPAERLGMHFVLAVSPGQIVADVERLVREQNSIAI